MSLISTATKGSYTLKISVDDDPTNPRVDCDNLGTMACWHRRYCLGDEHSHGEPRDLLASLVVESVSDKELIAYAKAGKAKDVRLQYDRHDRGWRLESYDNHFKEWFEEYFLDGAMKGYEYLFVDAILECLSTNNLMELAEKKHIILPLYLYDHSGITMNTTGFSCPWDSGQAGWIYVSHAAVKKEYGKVNAENLATATGVLAGEVECYDYYLTGQCYGFQFYEGGEEIESCWGFLGNFQDILVDVEGYLPDDCKGMTDDLTEKWSA